jgi:hypothetical protein
MSHRSLLRVTTTTRPGLGDFSQRRPAVLVRDYAGLKQVMSRSAERQSQARGFCRETWLEQLD